MAATTEKVYHRLQQRLDKLPIGYPTTDSGVEIRILQHLFTPLQAEIAIHMSYLPETPPIIFKHLPKGLFPNAGALEQELDKMAERGAIVRHISRKGTKIYSVIMLAVGMFEFQVDKMSKEFFQDFRQYLDEAFRDEVLNSQPMQLRPVPAEHSEMWDLPILPYDDLNEIVEGLEGPILVANCICKQGHDLLGTPCSVTDEREWCIILGGAAQNYHDLGWGRYIDKPELRDILAKAEKAGLVAQPSNSQKPFCICLCCGDCCEVLTSAKPLDNPVQYFNTNYYAVVDEEACTGCGICASKRCQMEAITIIDKKAKVDLTRCIGCGLCTTTCKAQAIRLHHKDKHTVPAATTAEMYINILRKRAGNAKMMVMLAKRLLGMRFI